MTEIRELEETAPVGSLFQDRDVAVVHAAFARLTAEQKEVISLRFFEELPHREVAKRMQRSANAVRQIQFRALARMKKLLEESVVTTA